MVISIEELRDLLNVESGIEKISSISSDGNNLLMRIPKDVRECLKLKKGEKFRWLVDKESFSVRLELIRKEGKNAKKKN